MDTPSILLFSSKDFTPFLTNLRAEMGKEIDKIRSQPSQLLTLDIDEIAKQLHLKYSPTIPTLKIHQREVDLEQTQINTKQIPRITSLDINNPTYTPGIKVTYFVPFDGDNDFFNYFSSKFPSYDVRPSIFATLCDNELHLIYQVLKANNDQELEKLFTEDIHLINKQLQLLQRQISEVTFFAEAKDCLQRIKNKYINDNGLPEKLTAPFRKKQLSQLQNTALETHTMASKNSQNQTSSSEPPIPPIAPIPLITFNSPTITDVGINKLKEVISKVQILLLTVNEWERKALLSEMTPLDSEETILQGALSSITYRIGMFGNYCVAHTESTMGSLGRQGATLTTQKAIDELKPIAVLLLGIAFGIDKTKQKLGDVLIAESIFPYELQKLNEKSSTHRGQAIPCGNILSERFRMRRTDWKPSHNGLLFDVNVFQGLVLSGDKVLNNKKFRDSLLKHFPNAIGGEMEAAGAYACVVSQLPNLQPEVILIKSICDWADGTKDDNAQPFAAFTSVSLAKHVLSKPDVLSPLSPLSSSSLIPFSTSHPFIISNESIPTFNNAPNKAKYPDQLIHLLKEKLESLLNKSPQQLFLGLKNFVDFISVNSPIKTIVLQLKNELTKKRDFTKNQLIAQKNKTIEIKNRLLAAYPYMDDSNKNDTDFNDDYGSPNFYKFSFKYFNSSVNQTLNLDETDNNFTPEDTHIWSMLCILKVKMDHYKIPDKQIWSEYLALERSYDHHTQEWSSYCQSSANVALSRVEKMVSKINPKSDDEFESIESLSTEEIDMLGKKIHEYHEDSWLRDILKGKNNNIQNDKKITSKIENLKQDLRQVYGKIYEEMVLANCSQESVIIALPVDATTNTVELNQEVPPIASTSSQANNLLQSILEKRKQELIEEITANYKQLGFSLSESGKVRLQRQINDLEAELLKIENKLLKM